jgi:hypothetical protein
MKKVLTILLVAAMLIQSSVAVLALSVEQEAPTNVTLSVSTGEIVAGETFDLTANIAMKSVRDKFKASLELADEFCRGYYTYQAALDKAKAEMRLAEIDGAFELVLTYPSAIVIPASVTKATAMDGFNADAKEIFAETKRTVVVGAETSTLTIEIKVKDGLSVGTLERNLEEYLADMTFTAKGLAAKAADSYALKGELGGYVNCNYSAKNSDMDIDGTINFVKGEGATAAITVTPALYTVSGTVENFTAPLTVTMGSYVVTVDGANYNIADVANGQYNLVVTDGAGKTKTEVVVVNGDDKAVNVAFAAVSTKVEYAPVTSTPPAQVVVDMTEVAEDAEDKGAAEVVVTVEEVTQAPDVDGKDNVEGLAKITTDVKDDGGSAVADVKKTLDLVFSWDSAGKDYLVVAVVDSRQVVVPVKEADEVNGTITITIDEELNGAEFFIAYNDQAPTVNPDADEEAPNDDPVIDNTGNRPMGGNGGYYVPDADDEEKTLDVAVWPFTDVNAGDWFYNAVAYTYKNGIFKGTTDTTFEPNLATTRGMIVTLIARIEKVSDTAITATSFTDVAENEYYATAIDWAAKNKIVLGYGDGTFGPNDLITREQLAAIWYRYQQYKRAVAEGDLDVELTFADAAQISDYAVDAVKFCFKKGIITGKENNILDPAGSATRAEVATVLMRYLNK